MVEILERLAGALALIGVDLGRIDRIEPGGAVGALLGHLDEVVDERENLGLMTEQVGDGMGARDERGLRRRGRVGGEKPVRMSATDTTTARTSERTHSVRSQSLAS